MKKVIVVILSLLVLILLTIWAYNALYNRLVEQNANVVVEETNNSDWMTYRNEELGIEFEYPKDWEYRISDSGYIQFLHTKQEYYLEGSITQPISISINQESNSWLENWIEARERYGGTVENVLINNMEVIRGVDYLGTYTVIQNNNKAYVLAKVNLGMEYDKINEAYKLIVNSWEFID